MQKLAQNQGGLRQPGGRQWGGGVSTSAETQQQTQFAARAGSACSDAAIPTAPPLAPCRCPSGPQPPPHISSPSAAAHASASCCSCGASLCASPSSAYSCAARLASRSIQYCLTCWSGWRSPRSPCSSAAKRSSRKAATGQAGWCATDSRSRTRLCSRERKSRSVSDFWARAAGNLCRAGQGQQMHVYNRKREQNVREGC